jgi:hypothetical protein
MAALYTILQGHDPGSQYERTIKCEESRLGPYQRASERSVECLRRFCREPASEWTQVSRRATRSVTITSGHGRVPRVFWGTERARGRMPGREARGPCCALILMGVWCVALGRSRPQPPKTRMRAKRHIGNEMPGTGLSKKTARGEVREKCCLLTRAF